MSHQTTSSRGLKALNTELRVDMTISREAQRNQYDETLNPTGSFPLNIAENRLNWAMLKAKFKQICSQHEIDDWVLAYTAASGAPEFKAAIAAFYQRYFQPGVAVDPMSLAISPGATGIVEMTAFILGDAGDTAAMPAPCYPVYRQDMNNMAGVLRYDIITHGPLHELAHGPLLDLSHLAQAKTDIAANGSRLRMLIITTPDNPTGVIYDQRHLLEIAEWCIAEEVHLIVNEIYALSAIDRTHKTIKDDYPDVDDFTSFLSIMADKQSNYLHHWYSFSKDFGISGFRVGVLHSHNEELIKAYENFNMTHSVSNHTQWMLMHLLGDSTFLDKYIEVNQQAITTSYVEVVTLCRKHEIPYVPSYGGLFIWIDMARYLQADSQAAEMKLWMDLYESTGILLTPGQGFGHLGFGKYRVVYPYVSLKKLRVALAKMDSFLLGRSAEA